jgi:hypothetical protein
VLTLPLCTKRSMATQRNNSMSPSLSLSIPHFHLPEPHHAPHTRMPFPTPSLLFSPDPIVQRLPISSPTTCQMTLQNISHPCTTIYGTRLSQAQLLPAAGSESFSWSYVPFSHTLLSAVLSSSIDPLEHDHDPKHGRPRCPFDAHPHSNRISLS